MGQANPHHGLELRLKILENRIRTFKERTSQAEGLQRIEALGAISRLEERYKQLKDRLDELSREDPGFRRRIRNQLEKLPRRTIPAIRKRAGTSLRCVNPFRR